ncbi:hypothetical protein C4556_03640 [Candidatus Parcubacteria bacterium]|nr:MAG: hypothetical protein C4556_03640 [Candidatus Parcubacteria bacterium]
MKYGALLGWGVVIYALMFLLWSGFVTYGFISGMAPRATALLVLIAIAAIAGASLRLNSWSDILPYSLAWGIMMALLDGVFSVPYTGWQLYFDLNVWFGYAVVVVAPLFAPYLRFRRFPSRPPETY